MIESYLPPSLLFGESHVLGCLRAPRPETDPSPSPIEGFISEKFQQGSVLLLFDIQSWDDEQKHILYYRPRRRDRLDSTDEEGKQALLEAIKSYFQEIHKDEIDWEELARYRNCYIAHRFTCDPSEDDEEICLTFIKYQRDDGLQDLEESLVKGSITFMKSNRDLISRIVSTKRLKLFFLKGAYDEHRKYTIPLTTGEPISTRWNPILKQALRIQKENFHFHPLPLPQLWVSSA